MKIYDEKWYRSGCEAPTINKDNEKWYYSMYETGVELHDCKISKFTVEQINDNNLARNKFVLELDCSGGFTAYDIIEFEYCTILEDADICGSWILADELYKLENSKIEFHLLLQRFIKNKDIVENFTVRCSSMVIKNSKNKYPEIIIDKKWNGEKTHKK